MLIATILGGTLAALLFAIVGTWGSWQRWPVVLLLAANLAAWAWVGINVMRGPMPAEWEWRTGEADVIAAYWREGQDIWLWVTWPNEAIPRAYRMGWNEELVEEIEKAEGSGEGLEPGELKAEFGEGTGQDGFEDMAEYMMGMLTRHYSPGPRVYPPPVPSEPPKRTEDRPTYQFRGNVPWGPSR